MKRIFPALFLAGCATTPEIAASRRPISEVRDCIVGRLINNWGTATTNTIGNRTVIHVVISDVRILQVEITGDASGASVSYLSVGMSHVKLREEVEACTR